jgi:hypothetical protein
MKSRGAEKKRSTRKNKRQQYNMAHAAHIVSRGKRAIQFNNKDKV